MVDWGVVGWDRGLGEWSGWEAWIGEWWGGTGVLPSLKSPVRARGLRRGGIRGRGYLEIVLGPLGREDAPETDQKVVG